MRNAIEGNHRKWGSMQLSGQLTGLTEKHNKPGINKQQKQ